MTDLKELEKFEADLKKLIEDRSKPFECNPQSRIRPNPPNSNTNIMSFISSLDTDATYMAVSEHGYGTDDTFMAVPEHGYNNFDHLVTKMVVPEHGQPYKKLDPPITLMVVPEHGQSYKTLDPAIFYTRMAIKEHGQPYKNK